MAWYQNNRTIRSIRNFAVSNYLHFYCLSMLRRVLDKKGGGYDMTEPRKRGTYVIDSYLCDVQFKGVVILLRHFLFTSVAWLTLTVVRECCLSRLNLSTTSVISGTSSTLNSTISDVFRNFK